MTSEVLAANMRQAMRLLDWEVRDLFVRTFAYGNVGTEADVGEHLRSANHLSPAQSAVVGAALNDALADIGSSLRV